MLYSTVINKCITSQQPIHVWLLILKYMEVLSTYIHLIRGTILPLINTVKHKRMKILKPALITILIIAAFFIGRYDEVLFDSSPTAGKIVISQELHDWSIDRDRDTKPVFITIFAKNDSETTINGPVKFQIDLDSSALEKSFIDSLINIIGEKRLVEDPGETEKFKAIASYIKRGKQLPNGMKHEPINGPHDSDYSTIVTANVNLQPGETKKIELEAMIPPKVRGYVLKIKQI